MASRRKTPKAASKSGVETPTTATARKRRVRIQKNPCARPFDVAPLPRQSRMSSGGSADAGEEPLSETERAELTRLRQVAATLAEQPALVERVRSDREATLHKHEALIKQLKSELGHWKASAEADEEALAAAKCAGRAERLARAHTADPCAQSSIGALRAADQRVHGRGRRRLPLRGCLQERRKGSSRRGKEGGGRRLR